MKKDEHSKLIGFNLDVETFNEDIVPNGYKVVLISKYRNNLKNPKTVKPKTYPVFWFVSSMLENQLQDHEVYYECKVKYDNLYY